MIRTGMAVVLGLAAVSSAAPAEVVGHQQTFVYEAFANSSATQIYQVFGLSAPAAAVAASKVLAVEEWPADPGHDMRSFVRFDLSGLSIDPGEQVVARFYVQPAAFPSSGNPTVADPVSVSIYAAQTGPWSESTTWNTQPDVAGTAIDTLSVTGINQFVEFDVTAAVQAWLASPSSYNGFVLVQDLAEFDNGSGKWAGVFFNGIGVTDATRRPTLAVIPEPALCGLLGLGSLLLMRRR